jgi:hypothetical protein
LNRCTAKQVAADDPQYPLVPNLAGNPRHENVMVYPVEELLQVDINHPPAAAGHMPSGCLQGLVSTPAGPKPVRAVGKVRVEQRHKHLM